MAEPAFHWALGMSAGAFGCTGAAVFTRKRSWLLAAPLVMTACGAFALIPDIPEVFHDYDWLPFAAELGTRSLKNLFHGPLGNIFFGHSWLDMRISKGEVIGLAGVIVMYSLCLLYYLWEILRLRRELVRCRIRSEQGVLAPGKGSRARGGPHPQSERAGGRRARGSYDHR